jgi:hypothetical protein
LISDWWNFIRFDVRRAYSTLSRLLQTICYKYIYTYTHICISYSVLCGI